MPLKPLKTVYTTKWSDPHDVYRGISNHWSVMRVEGELSVVKAKDRERAKKCKVTEAPAPIPGCTEPPYVWSRDQAHKLRGERPYYEFILEGLGGMLPGDLSKDLHKNYNKADIRWPYNIYRFHASKNIKYWVDDLTGLLCHPKLERNKRPCF